MGPRAVIIVAALLVAGVVSVGAVSFRDRELPRLQSAKSPTEAHDDPERLATPEKRVTQDAVEPPQPSGTLTKRPEQPPDRRPPRVFVWAAVPGAGAYEFQLFREETLVFRARTKRPQLELPVRWQFQGKRHVLTDGSYRWYVWSVPLGQKKAVARAAVQATFLVG